jgi:hypothetical protein
MPFPKACTDQRADHDGLLLEKAIERFQVVGVASTALFYLQRQVAKMLADGDTGQRFGRTDGNAFGPNGRRVAHLHFHKAAWNARGRIEPRGSVPVAPAVVVVFDSEQQARIRAERRKTLIAPSAGQLAGDPRVFGLRDDQPIAVVVATDQGSAPVPQDC